METKWKDAERFFEGEGFIYNEIEEGIELESWTRLRVDMLVFLDVRDYGAHPPKDWWKDQFKEYCQCLDVDEEIDLHREDKNYKMCFSISQSLKDFEEYEKWIEDVKSRMIEEENSQSCYAF